MVVVDKLVKFDGLQCHVISWSIDSPEFNFQKIEPLFRYLK